MDATVLRRYLQPSPTLRWHPWAPVGAGVLLLIGVFLAGALWGAAAAERKWHWLGGAGNDVVMRYKWQENHPGMSLEREAGKIDADVHRYVANESREKSWFEPWRDSIEARVFHNGISFDAPPKASIVHLAEFRLSELSRANPRWQATSTVCDEMHAMMRGERNMLRDYRVTADEYSRLLGRAVRPEDLAPAVSGWKCVY